MKQTYCNPLDLGYRYQHFSQGDRHYACREAADPTLVYFKGTYYLFASMSAGFWHSSDLINWEFHAAPDLLAYDYAPDVRQIGDSLYFCASRRGVNCPILRTSDPLSEPFEEVSAPFDFWDPDLFQDDDGRVYLYWGCGNTDPLYGVEMDPETMTPIGEKRALIFPHETELGYERIGENGEFDRESSVVYRQLAPLFDLETGKLRIQLPTGVPNGGFNEEKLTKMFRCVGKPYIEGSFMTKRGGKYYLQYACPGTQYNTYSDGVYVGDSPLGPFTLQESNPCSSKPGGFIQGAGHGSTIQDSFGNYWHASTMRISVGHDMERRLGLWPAGFDGDGQLFCNQDFGDYPVRIPEGKFDPWSIEPEWMLLSYQKPVTASSTAQDSDPALAVNEDIRSWWSAGDAAPGAWLTVDLEKESDVRAIQVNLADADVAVPFAEGDYNGQNGDPRHIEIRPMLSRYTLEGSLDGENWTLLETVCRECSNGYYEYPTGVKARYIRLTAQELPYGQPLRVSGLRVFGKGDGEKPPKAKAAARRAGDMDGVVTWESVPGAQGCNVKYGLAPEKLYHSWMVYGANGVKLSTLMKGRTYYIRVDSFNASGITRGDIIEMKQEGA